MVRRQYDLPRFYSLLEESGYTGKYGKNKTLSKEIEKNKYCVIATSKSSLEFDFIPKNPLEFNNAESDLAFSIFLYDLNALMDGFSEKLSTIEMLGKILFGKSTDLTYFIYFGNSKSDFDSISKSGESLPKPTKNALYLSIINGAYFRGVLLLDKNISAISFPSKGKKPSEIYDLRNISDEQKTRLVERMVL